MEFGIYNVYEQGSPDDIHRQIEELPLNQTEDRRDMVIWKGITDRVPTARAFLKFITTNEGTDDNMSAWQWVWSVQLLQRLRFFLWLTAHDKLLTNAYRLRIGGHKFGYLPTLSGSH